MFFESPSVAPDLVKAEFESALKRALEHGLPARSESSLDPETIRAIREVALVYPRFDRIKVQKARRELRFQLDGTHIRRREVARAADLRKLKKTGG